MDWRWVKGKPMDLHLSKHLDLHLGWEKRREKLILIQKVTLTVMTT
jgi:hypothetical protein